MADISVVEAGLDQIDELVSWRMETLKEVFHLSDDDDRLASLAQENRAFYERELAAGTHIACFALLDGVRVGCGSVCFQTEMPSPDNPHGTCAYLMNIYTRPDFQHKGVGKAVVLHLIEQAKRRGADKIYLETSLAGKHLYEEVGFKLHPYFMILREGDK